MRRKWDSKNEEIERKCIAEIIARIEETDGSAVGMIAAQDIMDIVTENLAPEIYNQGLTDAKRLIVQKLSDIDIDLSALEQQS